jgi:hypothetical protein
MPEWFIKYIGGGLLAVIGYVIISNTLWLIFGSRLLQSLPGVNIKGAKGTLRIAIMILMSFVALFVWFFNYLFHIIGISKKRTISSWISFFIQLASKIFSKALNQDN